MRHQPIIATPEEWKESESFRFKCFALGNLCNLLAMKPRKDARQIELLAAAAALAHELFPPSAKALEWNVVGSTILSTDRAGLVYGIYPYDEKFFADFGPGGGLVVNIGAGLATIDEAKAFCESHHQARFKGLLA